MAVADQREVTDIIAVEMEVGRLEELQCIARAGGGIRQQEEGRKMQEERHIMIGREILVRLDKGEVQIGDAGGGGGWYGGAGARYFKDSSDSSKERYCGGGGGSGYIGGVNNGTSSNGNKVGNGEASITLIE